MSHFTNSDGQIHERLIFLAQVTRVNGERTDPLDDNLAERRRGLLIPISRFGLEAEVRTKVKQISLGVCLFVFLFVVIGGGLHLSSSGAFLAAATGTPLLIHVLNRQRTRGLGEPSLRSPSRSPAAMHEFAQVQSDDPDSLDSEELAGR